MGRYMNRRAFSYVVLLSAFSAGSLWAESTRGILGQKGPLWQVDQWVQLPGDRNTLDVNDLQGKVVYLYCFQAWCPGCHRHGFPTLQEMIAHYHGQEDVVFVAVQTVFEGFSANPPSRVKEMAQRYRLKIPMGHSGSPQKRSTLMQRYRTGGTPWTIIIDRQGVVRFNDFHIQPDAAGRLIDHLRRN